MKNEKEYYRLWWEYLRRSPDYQEFCEWYQESLKKSETLIPEKFEKGKAEIKNSALIRYYDFIAADCHGLSFDDLWKHKKKRIEFSKNWEKDRLIQNYSKFAEKDFNTFINYFKKFHGREPTMNEFKKIYYKDHIDSQLLIIDPRFYEPKEIIQELSKISKEIIRNYRSRMVRIDGLKRYLQVYDLWKQTDENGKRKFTLKEIIKRVGDKSQKEKADDANVQRAFRADLAKAKKIIKNTERGIFPGKYY